jgi:hypothetical protein
MKLEKVLGKSKVDALIQEYQQKPVPLITKKRDYER